MASTKYFNFDGDAAKALLGELYPEGAQVEYTMFSQPTMAVQGWSNLSIAQRNSIRAKLLTTGWLEGEETPV